MVDIMIAVGLHHTPRVQGSCVVLNTDFLCKETKYLSCQAINKPTLCLQGNAISFIHIHITNFLEKIAQHKKIVNVSAHMTY